MVGERALVSHVAAVGRFEGPYTFFGDDALIDAMLARPILINRPIVVTPLATRLCRPSEAVLDILPLPQRGAFTKEDGEQVVNERGERVAGR